jgi:hypothetical protein
MLVLDEATRESWNLGFPNALLPEDNLIVVATETEHHEKGLHEAALQRKTEMCTAPLSPAGAAVFRNCSTWAILLDAKRHIHGRLSNKRLNLLWKPFVFNQGKGLGNENVLAKHGPDDASDKGPVWCLYSIQFAVFVSYLGSPDSFAPVVIEELHALVGDMFNDLQEETNLLYEAEKATSTSKEPKAVTWDQSLQYDATVCREQLLWTGKMPQFNADRGKRAADASGEGGVGFNPPAKRGTCSITVGSGSGVSADVLQTLAASSVVSAASGLIGSAGPAASVVESNAAGGEAPAAVDNAEPAPTTAYPDLYLKSTTVRFDGAGQPKMNGSFMHLIPAYVGESIYAPCKWQDPSGKTLVYISDTSWALLPKTSVAAENIWHRRNKTSVPPVPPLGF